MKNQIGAIDKNVESIAHGHLASNFAGTALAGAGIIISDQKTSFDVDYDMLPEPDEIIFHISDGRIAKYLLADCAVFIHRDSLGNVLFIGSLETSLRDIISLHFDAGEEDYLEMMASWGFEDECEEAPDDATDARVWIEPNYYRGSVGTPIAGFARGEDGCGDRPLVFATRADAQEWIEEQEKGIYYLSHGEAGAPTYTVVE